ncbi:ribosome-associated protein [Nocardioides albertanoniae]|uniref:Ribosome-associated protein n=1 Tax=Nocardioides albertanoniae TaxID=1175486 RepID=A0A543ABR1_9ACTN|nr:alternative ribosome rescue aminoacyl-tRNA hydrolase ArfB [Nocardioides albertanoniae]TQL69999.1 ribosome-associated protein [Nocardioides albertanoniae]
MDLRVPPGPGLPEGLNIPDAELVERFSRSPGPGGQSVNTTDSRVELEWDPAASKVLDDTQRSRLLARARGPITVVSHEQRSQHRNRVAARERMAERVRSLLAPPPPPRRPTRPTRGSKERRLDAKRQRSRTKQLRGRVQD